MPLLRPRDSKKPDILKDTNDEYFRTNTNMSVDQGDAPSFEKKVDPRLPKLFKFEYGGQNGYVVLPKGRIVAVVPDRVFKNFDDNKYYPGITIANGGVDVEESNDDPEGDGGNYTRVANKPVGVCTLNTYQDIDDEFQGSIPGFVTRNSINLPLFGTKEKAEQIEWGSAYGDLKPGDKVQSDANGRFIKWEDHKTRTQGFTGDGANAEFQLDYAVYPEGKVVATVADEEVEVASVVYPAGVVTLAAPPADPGDGSKNVEITYQSVVGDDPSQLVGQILCVDENLIPAGWLKWVMPENDYNEPTGFTAGDLTDEGYPYDSSYGEFNKERPTGIPGLTDGMNYIKEYSDAATNTDPVEIGEVNDAWTAGETANLRLDERFLPVKEVLSLKVGNTDIAADDYAGDTEFKFDKETGLLRITLAADTIPAEGSVNKVVMEFTATHQMAGMPTHIDFEGVVGSVDILLQL